MEIKLSRCDFFCWWNVEGDSKVSLEDEEDSEASSEIDDFNDNAVILLSDPISSANLKINMLI